MGVFSNLGASIFTAITGQDPAALSNQLTAAEQQATLAVEALLTLQALSLLALVFILLELRRGR